MIRGCFGAWRLTTPVALVGVVTAAAGVVMGGAPVLSPTGAWAQFKPEPKKSRKSPEQPKKIEPTAGVIAAPKVTARQAILLSWPLGVPLLMKNADQPMAPSSMTKLMTVLLVIEAIESGKLKPAARIKMPKAATRTRGSRMRLKAGTRVTVQRLLEATVIGSANDAAKALAITVAGSERKFAERMTARAKAIGLLGSTFRNATGFSAKGHQMTARDVARLSAHLVFKQPKYFPMFSKRRIKIGKRVLKNRNPVLGRVQGADGLKTGQTRAGGYGLAATAKRGNTRLILVINGLKSAKARRREATRLLEWGFKILAR